MNKAFLNWSSGKDATMALVESETNSDLSIEKLVTTYNSDFNRVSMHGLDVALLEQQAEALGLPLMKVALSGTTPMDEYNRIIARAHDALKNAGFTHSVFGDIFLEDLKNYREEQTEKAGLKCRFPLWKRNTQDLIDRFISQGYKALAVCIDAQKLDKSFCGREIDRDFIKDLPAGVDPCGENGEFHTFVYDGPRFSKPVSFDKKEIVMRDYSPENDDDDHCFKDDIQDWSYKFYYRELTPKSQS